MHSDIKRTLVAATFLCITSPAIVRAAPDTTVQLYDPSNDAGIMPPAAALQTTSTGQLAQLGPGPDRTGGTLVSPRANTGSNSGIAVNPANNTTGTQLINPPPLPLAVKAPRSGLLPAFGFPNVGQTLLNDGVEIHGLAFDHFEGNPSTGFVPGHNYNLAAVNTAVDLNLQRLIGLEGGYLHLALTYFAFRSNIPNYVFQVGGEINGLQTTPAARSVTLSLSLFTYEQKLLNNKLSLQVGRANPFQFFELSNSLDPAAYFSGVFDVVADVPSPRFPVWAGVVNYHFTPALAVQGAAFEDNFPKATLNPDVFGTDGAAGVSVFASLEYRTEFNTAAYPANGELGINWNTRHGRSNIKGLPVLYNGRNAATDYHGGGILFGQGEKVVWRGAPRRGAPPANIALYGQFNAVLDKPQPFDLDATAGVNFTGLIPGRPFDALGIQVRYQKMSQIEANFETRVQDIFAGRGRSQARDALAYEVVGNVQVAPWLQLRPFVEAFVKPDAYLNNGQRTRPHSGFEFGALGVVPIGPLLGTSPKPF